MKNKIFIDGDFNDSYESRVKNADPDRKVTVCANCLRASCWQGEFYCEEYKTAATKEVTVRELAGLNLESKDYWR